MRVIGGTYRGRRLAAPRGTVTRPTSDRVREAVFSRIEAAAADALSGTVLDLFAGSGALGIEALSRGAHAATFIERDRGARACLRANLASLGLLDVSTVLPGDARTVAARGALPGAPFSLLLVDPPYGLDKSEVRRTIEALVESGALAARALVVWEHASSDAPDWPRGFDDLGARQYGDTTVTMARLEGGAR